MAAAVPWRSGAEFVQLMREHRHMACSIVLQRDGVPRSAKSTSIAQTEADVIGFGERRAKCHSASLQDEAWARNARLLAPLCLALAQPADTDRRERGNEVVLV